MKISIAEIKRHLVPGTKYIGEYLSAMNRANSANNIISTREVVSNKTSMESIFTDGPKVGVTTTLNWKSVEADERDGSIYLTMTEVNPPVEFLKITIL